MEASPSGAQGTQCSNMWAGAGRPGHRYGVVLNSATHLSACLARNDTALVGNVRCGSSEQCTLVWVVTLLLAAAAAAPPQQAKALRWKLTTRRGDGAGDGFADKHSDLSPEELQEKEQHLVKQVRQEGGCS